MTQGDRLVLLVNKLYHGSKSAFADAMGVSYQTLQPYYNNKMSMGNKMRIRLRLINVNPDWVINGEGDMLLAGNTQTNTLNTTKHLQNTNINLYDETTIVDLKSLKDSELLLNYFPHPVGAGFQIAENVEPYSVDVISIITYNKNKSFLAEVSGSSMIDAGISPGDHIVVNPTFIPEDNDIVVVALNGLLVVKRFKIIESDRYLFSDNINILPVKLNGADSIKIFGVVEHILKSTRRRNHTK